MTFKDNITTVTPLNLALIPGKGPAWRASWWLTTVVSTLALAGLCALLVMKFNESRIRVTITLKHNRLPFPAVTLCNLNPYKKSAIAQVPELQALLENYKSMSKPSTNTTAGEPTVAQQRRKRSSCTCSNAGPPAPITTYNGNIYALFSMIAVQWDCGADCCGQLAAAVPGSTGMQYRLARLDSSALIDALYTTGIINTIPAWCGLKGTLHAYNWYDDATTTNGAVDDVKTLCPTCIADSPSANGPSFVKYQAFPSNIIFNNSAGQTWGAMICEYYNGGPATTTTTSTSTTTTTRPTSSSSTALATSTSTSTSTIAPSSSTSTLLPSTSTSTSTTPLAIVTSSGSSTPAPPITSSSSVSPSVSTTATPMASSSATPTATSTPALSTSSSLAAATSSPSASPSIPTATGASSSSAAVVSTSLAITPPVLVTTFSSQAPSSAASSSSILASSASSSPGMTSTTPLISSATASSAFSGTMTATTITVTASSSAAPTVSANAVSSSGSTIIVATSSTSTPTATSAVTSAGSVSASSSSGVASTASASSTAPVSSSIVLTTPPATTVTSVSTSSTAIPATSAASPSTASTGFIFTSSTSNAVSTSTLPITSAVSTSASVAPTSHSSSSAKPTTSSSSSTSFASTTGGPTSSSAVSSTSATFYSTSPGTSAASATPSTGVATTLLPTSVAKSGSSPSTATAPPSTMAITSSQSSRVPSSATTGSATTYLSATQLSSTTSPLTAAVTSTTPALLPSTSTAQTPAGPTSTSASTSEKASTAMPTPTTSIGQTTGLTTRMVSTVATSIGLIVAQSTTDTVLGDGTTRPATTAGHSTASRGTTAGASTAGGTTSVITSESISISSLDTPASSVVASSVVRVTTSTATAESSAETTISPTEGVFATTLSETTMAAEVTSSTVSTGTAPFVASTSGLTAAVTSTIITPTPAFSIQASSARNSQSSAVSSQSMGATTSAAGATSAIISTESAVSESSISSATAIGGTSTQRSDTSLGGSTDISPISSSDVLLSSSTISIADTSSVSSNPTLEVTTTATGSTNSLTTGTSATDQLSTEASEQTSDPAAVTLTGSTSAADLSAQSSSLTVTTDQPATVQKSSAVSVLTTVASGSDSTRITLSAGRLTTATVSPSSLEAFSDSTLAHTSAAQTVSIPLLPYSSTVAVTETSGRVTSVSEDFSSTYSDMLSTNSKDPISIQSSSHTPTNLEILSSTSTDGDFGTTTPDGSGAATSSAMISSLSKTATLPSASSNQTSLSVSSIGSTDDGSTQAAEEKATTDSVSYPSSSSGTDTHDQSPSSKLPRISYATTVLASAGGSPSQMASTATGPKAVVSAVAISSIHPSTDPKTLGRASGDQMRSTTNGVLTPVKTNAGDSVSTEQEAGPERGSTSPFSTASFGKTSPAEFSAGPSIATRGPGASFSSSSSSQAKLGSQSTSSRSQGEIATSDGNGNASTFMASPFPLPQSSPLRLSPTTDGASSLMTNGNGPFTAADTAISTRSDQLLTEATAPPATARSQTSRASETLLQSINGISSSRTVAGTDMDLRASAGGGAPLTTGYSATSSGSNDDNIVRSSSKVPPTPISSLATPSNNENIPATVSPSEKSSQRSSQSNSASKATSSDQSATQDTTFPKETFDTATPRSNTSMRPLSMATELSVASTRSKDFSISSQPQSLSTVDLNLSSAQSTGNPTSNVSDATKSSSRSDGDQSPSSPMSNGATANPATLDGDNQSTPSFNESLMTAIETMRDSLAEVHSSPEAMSATIEDIIPYLLATLPPEVAIMIGYNISEVLVRCSYNGRRCGVGDFRLQPDPNYGNCYTFNAGAEYTVATQTGKGRGLSVTYAVGEAEYLDHVQLAGVRVVTNGQNEAVFPNNDGVNAPSGYQVTATLRRMLNGAMNTTAKTCADSKSDVPTFNYNASYSSEACLRSCYQNYVIGKCQCGDPRVPLPENSKASYCRVTRRDCVNDFYGIVSKDNVTQCYCPPSCRTDIFDVTSLTTTKWSRSYETNSDAVAGAPMNRSVSPYRMSNELAQIELYYDDLTIVEYAEKASYSLQDVLWDMSAVISLLLGVSVLSVFEVVHILQCLRHNEYERV